jgi:hypothetical protein
MQTSGTILLTAKPCSLVRMRRSAQISPSHGCRVAEVRRAHFGPGLWPRVPTFPFSMFDPVHLGQDEYGQPFYVDLGERDMLLGGESARASRAD